MKILVCHNYYQQRGGEDQSFEDEVALLRGAGHEVIAYTRHNSEVQGLGKLALAGKTVFNRAAYRELSDLIRSEKPILMHCTNTLPLISPAAYYAARKAGIAVVQSLRNYRYLCPGIYCLRDGKVCEDCLGKSFAWPGIVHACYRNSRGATAVVAGMYTLHRLLRTWMRTVDVYYTLTQFARDKLIQGGLPAARVVVKQNCVQPDPGIGPGDGGFAVFLGRLSPEKGIHLLLNAWQHTPDLPPLKIIGDGPLAAEVAEAARRQPDQLHYLGPRPLAEALELVGQAQCLVMPSLWYETFGRTIIEAYAKGTPVVASDLGAMSELVDVGQTGYLFDPGNPDDLADKLRQVWASPAPNHLRVAARARYEARYTPQINYQKLIGIYELALARNRTRLAPGSVAKGMRPDPEAPPLGGVESQVERLRTAALGAPNHGGPSPPAPGTL